jgi:hypothetical protein
LFLVLLMMPVAALARRADRRLKESQLADSVVEKTIFFAQAHSNLVHSYKAQLYMKGHLNIVKKNFAFRYIPQMFKMKKGVDEYLVESNSDLHYTSPNIYDQKVQAVSGTTSEGKFQATMCEYFHVNIYSSTLLGGKILSPLAVNARKYYRYVVDTVYHYDGHEDYKLRFIPRSRSDQLVGGYMIVSSDVWSVREIRYSGRSGLITFQNYIVMGAVGNDSEFLPVTYDFNARFRFLGNVVDCHYLTYLMYDEIELKEKVMHVKERDVLDLTNSYSLLCDTNAMRRDNMYFDSIRPVPLSDEEHLIYSESATQIDTTVVVNNKKRSRVLWGEVGEFLVNDININLASFGYVKCSPIINPFLLSYSKSNGFSWQQKFKFNRLYNNGKLLRVVPSIGYNFTRKEFYWAVTSEFSYWPRKRGELRLNMGNGNRIYSSEVLKELKSMSDNDFDFNSLQLNYFYDLYFSLKHSIEIVNGLEFDAGFSVHRRTPVGKVKFPDLEESEPVAAEYLESMRSTYVSFAPHIRLTWTPFMKYYMDGNRKVNINSDFPTFSVDYERGIKGVLGSTGEYEKLEMDVQHKLNLEMMRSLFYRFGFGFFTRQRETYFVDFANFSRSNLPTGWNDDIGGVFQLLDRRWYNSSRSYIRANATYESPFFLLRHNNRLLRYVQNERLYAGAVVMPHLKPYTEFGYGIGTHIFDFGVFVGLENWKYSEIGCKFTFELFNR